MQRFSVGAGLTGLLRRAKANSNAARAPSAPEVRIELRVVGVFPHVHQAVVRSTKGLQYTITRATPGVHVDELREGQRLSCVVAADVPKILEAQVLA